MWRLRALSLVFGVALLGAAAVTAPAQAATTARTSLSWKTLAQQARQRRWQWAPSVSASTAGIHATATIAKTINDGTDDQQDLVSGAHVTNQPVSDIVQGGAGVDRTSSQFSAEMAAPDDPANTGVVVIWGIDTDYDGTADWIAVVGSDGFTDSAQLGRADAENASCDGTANFDGTQITASFSGSCPRFPSFQWGVLTLLDPGDGHLIFDVAPNSGLGSPVPVHRTGYLMLGETGIVYGFGNAPSYGGNVGFVRGIATRADGTGVWLADAVGHVFTRGRAPYKGGASTVPFLPGEIVTTMAATPSNKGYWLFSNRGRVFPFGDAKSFGDLRNKALNGPIIASVATPTGNGYFMVGSDGGIFTFGDAHFHGSTGNKHLNAPIVGIAPTPDNTGYWLVASDGGVFSFNAPFRGSLGNKHLNAPIVGMVAYGNGYLLVGSDGGVFDFSNKAFLGSLGATHIPAPIIAIVAYSI